MKRRDVLQTAAALGLGALPFAPAQAQSTTLKISHQFPGGTIKEGDFRDRLVRVFAAEVEKRSKGALKFDIYPGSSLMKTLAQFSSMRKGALDMALVPLSYAGGEIPEVNIGLMPGLVTSYAQAYGWKNKPVGQELTRLLQEKGIVLITWIWQAGGVASRNKPIINPEDAKGLKVRGGSAEMDMILKEAGASVVTLPSNEIYAGMQTGAMDAAMTSSTSLISFRLEEVAKSLTTGRTGAYWFMFEPLMMSKQVFDALWTGEGQDVDAVIAAKGLKQMNDTGALEKIIDTVIAANADNVAQFKAGKDKAFNALVGQVMKASQGKANPAQVNELLKKKLS
jgi:TRAP-type C4-dicarboxylate transport system substrate-binding protein